MYIYLYKNINTNIYLSTAVFNQNGRIVQLSSNYLTFKNLIDLKKWTETNLDFLLNVFQGDWKYNLIIK